MKPVLTKADFVRRYQLGEFGNAAPTWNTLEDFEKVPFSLPLLAAYDFRHACYHIRNRIAGGPTYYNISWLWLPFKWAELVTQGVRPDSLYISAMAPTLLTIIQGEVQHGLWGLDLTWSFLRLPMREALAKDRIDSRGLEANVILRRYMCQQSYEWLEYLLEEYPDHVVEFSVYDCEWGTVPGHNTVFWECRLY